LIAAQSSWDSRRSSKSIKAIGIPVNSDAINAIQIQLGSHHSHVFSYRGKPVSKAGGNAWEKSLQRANIHDFHWHDLRHTWASWHAQAGTPLNILLEQGDWNNYETVIR
jgi:integrase